MSSSMIHLAIASELSGWIDGVGFLKGAVEVRAGKCSALIRPLVLPSRSLTGIEDAVVRMSSVALPSKQAESMSAASGRSEQENHAREVKANFRVWSRRMNRALIFWVSAGIATGATLWCQQRPRDRDGAFTSGVFGTGLGVFFIGAMLTRLVNPMPDTQCPQCRYQWRRNELGGEYPSDAWLDWKHCPGCGILMEESQAGQTQTRPERGHEA